MSQADAVAFLDRVESDEDFAKNLESIKEDPQAVYEKITASGFDASPDEIQKEFLDRYGAELTPEQLEQVAAGEDFPYMAVVLPVLLAGAAAGAV